MGVITDIINHIQGQQASAEPGKQYTYDASTQKYQAKKKGGKVSASTRADGCAVKGKTKGKFV
jgi:hypothetical protein